MEEEKLARNRARHRATIAEYKRCKTLGIAGRGCHVVAREYGTPPIWLCHLNKREY